MQKQARTMTILLVLAAFLSSSLQVPVYASALTTLDAMKEQGILPFMPKPGVMVHLSPEYTPAYLKGIVIHPEDPLKFDFIIFKGDQELTLSQKQEEYTKLTKYFLASLAIPDDDQWVNLSPYEKDRIIKDDFGKTEMGRDLLAQDYLLKQITASLIYPEDRLGKEFWDKVYRQAQKQYGTTNIPVNTFNKVWILPDDALIYEKDNTAYILKNHLRVMLEEDYLSLQKHAGIQSAPANGTHTIASKIVKEIVLPELQREVNEDKNFAALRQVYSGMLLATWFKRALKESLLGQIYANKARVKGVDQDPTTNEEIYRQYLRAYKKGVFNFIKEDVNQYTNETIPRKYFSGGIKNNYAQIVQITRNPAMGDKAMAKDIGNDDVADFSMETTSANSPHIEEILKASELQVIADVKNVAKTIPVTGTSTPYLSMALLPKGSKIKLINQDEHFYYFEVLEGVELYAGNTEAVKKGDIFKLDKGDELALNSLYPLISQEGQARVSSNQAMNAAKPTKEQMDHFIAEMTHWFRTFDGAIPTNEITIENILEKYGYDRALFEQLSNNRDIRRKELFGLLDSLLGNSDALPPNVKENVRIEIASYIFQTGPQRLSFDPVAMTASEFLAKMKEKVDAAMQTLSMDTATLERVQNWLEGLDNPTLAHLYSRALGREEWIKKEFDAELERHQQAPLGNRVNYKEINDMLQCEVNMRILEDNSPLNYSFDAYEAASALDIYKVSRFKTDRLKQRIQLIWNRPETRKDTIAAKDIYQIMEEMQMTPPGFAHLPRGEFHINNQGRLYWHKYHASTQPAGIIPVPDFEVRTLGDSPGIYAVELSQVAQKTKMLSWEEQSRMSNEELVNQINMQMADIYAGFNVTHLQDKPIRDPELIKRIFLLVRRELAALRDVPGKVDLDNNWNSVGGISLVRALNFLKKQYPDVDAAMTGTTTDDKAMTKGGIDLNSANLNLLIKRDGRGVVLPLVQQDLAQLKNIAGLSPVILSIKPASQTAVFAQAVSQP